MPVLYDTHTHLNLSAFKDNYKEIAEQSLALGMIINNVGTHTDTSKKAVEIAELFESGVYAVVGLHPEHTLEKEVHEEQSHFVSRAEGFDYEFFKNLASSKKVVGIGECGIDYYRTPEGMTRSDMRKLQEPLFLEHIKLARELDKALVIHIRATKDTIDAYEDVLDILSKEKDLPRFEIHSFTANLDLAKKFVELGGYIGLNGIITFDKTGVLKEVVRHISLEKMVLETDAPYLAPAPYRGKTNLPQYVEYVAKYIAEVKNISFEEVCEVTTANAKTLFKV